MNPMRRDLGSVRFIAVESLHGRPLAAHSIAAQVDDDAVEPRLKMQRPDPSSIVGSQGMVRTDEGVLGQILGLLPAARRPVSEGVQSPFVGEHKVLEAAVEILRQALLQIGNDALPLDLFLTPYNTANRRTVAGLRSATEQDLSRGRTLKLEWPTLNSTSMSHGRPHRCRVAYCDRGRMRHDGI